MRRVLAFLIWSLSLNRPLAAQETDVAGIVSEPDRFHKAIVTVTGEYRGRNTFDDLTDRAPGTGAFVIRSGAAAIWITDADLHKAGFSRLDDREREQLDTLEITGTVVRQDGRVWIRARTVRLVASQPRADAAASPPASLPLDVTFSTPLAKESNVALKTAIRVQFSDDLVVSTTKDRVRLTYVAPESAAGESVEVPFTLRWHAANRSLELVPEKPFEAHREVRVELLEGITSVIGGTLKPWTLTFRTGGS